MFSAVLKIRSFEAASLFLTNTYCQLQLQKQVYSQQHPAREVLILLIVSFRLILIISY